MRFPKAVLYFTCFVYISLCGLYPGKIAAVEKFPKDSLIPATLGDPRTPRNSLRFFVLEEEEGTEDLLGAEGSLTQNFGIVRWTRDKYSYQLSMNAGVFSMFQEAPDQYELVNADYHVGFPLEIAWDKQAVKLKLYHVSSHLGDEYAERTGRKRISYSHETLRGTWFRSFSPRDRFYVSGSYALHLVPDEGRVSVRTGWEHLGEEWFWAANFRAREMTDWDPATMIQGGRLFGNKSLAVGVFLFQGPLPTGQFYDEERSAVGFSVKFWPRTYCGINLPNSEDL